MSPKAMIAAMTDLPIHAARLFGAADALRGEVGGTHQSNDCAIRDHYLTHARDLACSAAWADGAILSPPPSSTPSTPLRSTRDDWRNGRGHGRTMGIGNDEA